MKCHIEDILVYADKILFIARSVTGLQNTIGVIETYLNWLDLSLNSVNRVACVLVRGLTAHVPILSLEQVKLFHGSMRFNT
jgi:hypothetical protein